MIGHACRNLPSGPRFMYTACLATISRMENLCPPAATFKSTLASSAGLTCIAMCMLIATCPAARPALLMVMVSVAVNDVMCRLVCAARLIAWRGLAVGGAVPQPVIITAHTAASPAAPMWPAQRPMLAYPNTREPVLMPEQ